MPKSYKEKYEGDLELSTLLSNRFNDLKNEIKVQLPCKVVAVDYVNNQVDLEILDYDFNQKGELTNYAILPNVPIRQPIYSGSAYMILPVRVGDIGTVEFFDSSVDDLVSTGAYDFDYSEDWHNIGYGLFTNGFLPKNKLITINSTDKVILKTQDGNFSFTVNSNNELIINAPSVSITGNVSVTGDITATGTITGNTDVIASGKSGKLHTHTDSMGGTTSSPN